MKYFTYSNRRLTRRLFKERLQCAAEQRRQHRKAVWARRLSFAAACMIGIICAAALIYFSAAWSQAARITVRITGMLIILIGVIFLFALADRKLPRFEISDHSPKIRRDSCGFLREFYGFCEPYLITKCYRCSGARWNNHDVCLFFAKDGLRITADIWNGFFDGACDLGCYQFGIPEIAAEYAKLEEKTAARLCAGDFTMELGKRALPFLRREGK